MTKTFSSQPEYLGLGVALVLLTGVTARAYLSIDRAEDTLGWVEHAGEVVRELEQLSGAYGRAVSARRSYVIAGDTTQLAEVPDLDARLANASTSLRRSISSDSAQFARLERLERLFHQRIVGLDAAIEERRRSGSGAQETADVIMLGAKIRSAREEMEEVENRQLAARDHESRADVSRTKVGVVVGTLASFAMLLLAFRVLRREISRRRGSEAFLDSIVENLPNMIFVKEAGELRFERINRAGEALLGLTRTELVGKNDFDFFPSEQAKFFQARDRDALHGGSVVDIPEEEIMTKGGPRWLHTKKVPVLDGRGAPRYLLGISEDITERRTAALALREAKDAAEAANQELEAFSYSVAHDLRAPLRAIDGFSLALEEDCGSALDAAGREHLRRVRSSATKMGQLIDGLLSLSRVSRGDVRREEVDLTKTAEQSVAQLRAADPTRHVDVEVARGLSVQGDARLLAAALDNLIGNAWKFTSRREGARIQVGREAGEGSPVFFVRDNGAGFDQAFANKLFGAFQRLHRATEFEGTGIGLATVQRIIRRHGGRVWAEGAEGQGATFYFTL
jgi:PAS domain S-box-containing protein